MSEPKYIVGIDLGTSNCAMASVEIGRGADSAVTDFLIPQARRAGEVGAQALLPSAIYIPGEHDLAPELIRLPWNSHPEYVIGEFGRWQGSRVPGRLVTSAKSWLCNPGVDRSAPILPWGAPPDVRKLSPVQASSLLLSHMVDAWNSSHPDGLLSEQEVVVTVPASFDEVARALTVNAARQAGLEKFTLLEEPQAAFYDFTARHRTNLVSALANVRLVLVVDVGGGTSDFTLVHTGVTPEGPVLRRLAVGEHLMLGGDNMDNALARKLEEQITGQKRRLSATQWSQLLQAARVAKEVLLGPSARSDYNISIASEGSRLIGSSLSAQLTRNDAEQTVLEGFFPFVSPLAEPLRTVKTGIHELGLPYAQDPAITRHVGAFLRLHAASGFKALGAEALSGALPRPDAILLNGGVFNSPKISDKLISVISSWWPDQPRIGLLHHESLELAVARGAAYYGLVRRGLGRKITGGAAHAFYIGLARPKETVPTTALCVLPRGHEEGETLELKGQVFELTLGRPVQFPLFTTTRDRVDKPGDIIPVTDELQALPPIFTMLKGGAEKSPKVPVYLRAALTEIGTLELSCVSNVSNEHWRLEFELRSATAREEVTVIESMPAHFSDAKIWIEHIYGHKLGEKAKSGQPPKDVKQLWGSLERTLGARETWRVPILRELWSALYAARGRRRRSAEHERIYFQLIGYTLRPGFGYPLDSWRCEQTFTLFSESVQFHKEKTNWNEFWIMWRRTAGGLNDTLQVQLWDYLKPYLTQRVSHQAPKSSAKSKGISPEGLEEMVRTAASLEHLPATEKEELGGWIAHRLKGRRESGGPWTWALGRLGARAPIYGSSHRVTSPGWAAEWISLLLELGLEKMDGAAFAVAQMARLTGDRSRDIDSVLRARVIEALRKVKPPESWLRMVEEVVVLEVADEARALGDTIPAGLQFLKSTESPL